MDTAVLEKIGQPPFPEPVSSVEVKPYWDFDGEESLWVDVYLKAGTDIRKMHGNQISEIKDLIWERLRNEHIELFPYFGIRIDGEVASDEGADEETE